MAPHSQSEPSPRLAKRERAIRNDAQRAVLLKQGDNPSAPREVDHFARFPTRFTRWRFTLWLRASGYGVANTRTVKDHLPRRAITFVRVHPIDDTLDATTDQLATKIESLHGVYEGWGCQPRHPKP